jgi:hypothetical protein
MSLPRRAVSKSKEEITSTTRVPSSEQGVSARQAAVASGRGAVLGPRPPSVEEPLKKFGPITLENYLAKKERSQTRKRERLNQSRVEKLCHPFRIELRAITHRRTNVIREVNRIQDELRSIQSLMIQVPHGSHSSNKRNYIEQLQHFYMLERLQKQEEIMRLVDRMIALQTIIENIHRQHEIPLIDHPGAFGFDGGAPNKSGTRRHKWSLKYKRSIDCNHPKGFSQRQHCKYGRKNVIKKQ